jgi:hypothetical protein
MAEHAETLKAMLQDFINGKEEQAAVTMHDYFVAKTKDVAGLVQGQDVDTDNEIDD